MTLCLTSVKIQIIVSNTKISHYLWCSKNEKRQDIILCLHHECKRMKRCTEYQELERRILDEVQEDESQKMGSSRS